MKKIFIIIALLLSFFITSGEIFATNNVKVDGKEHGGRVINNAPLDDLKSKEFFVTSGAKGEKGLKNLLLNIARDLRVIVFAVVMLFGIIMVIKLLFGSNTEEEQQKLKSGILWASIGIIVMQIAFSVYKILFDRDIDAMLARSMSERIIEPFINMLLLFASFAFLAMGIYAFYKLVTANGDDDKVSKGKMTIVYAIIGFLILNIVKPLVKNTFNPDCGSGGKFISFGGAKVCENVTKNAQIITSILNWLNTFVTILIVIMVIYAGFLILTSGGDEEKQSKAKKILLYVAVGLVILFMSYLITTFFIKPESII